MFKYIKFIIFIAVLCPLNVLALRVSVEESSEYFLKFDDKIIPLKIFYLEEEDKYLFNFSINEKIDNYYVLTMPHNYANFLNIDVQTWQQLTNILHFGYMYSEHTSFKWYLLTQNLIYDTLNLNVTILDSNGVDIKVTYKNEYEKYLELLEEYLILPSYFLDEIHFNITEKYQLKDNNNVDYQYTIFPSSNLYLSSDKHLSVIKPGVYTIYGVKNNVEKQIPIIYFNSELMLLERTIPSEVIYENEVYVHGGKIKIVNTTEEGEVLGGASYDLYNSKDELVKTLKISNGYALTDYLPLDDYYLIETTCNENYILNSYKIPVHFKDYGTSEVIVKSKLKTGSINVKLLKKEFINSDTELYGGVTFILENMNGEVLDVSKTDLNGELVFQLPPGEYKLKLDSDIDTFEKIIKIGIDDEIFVEHIITINNYVYSDNVLEEDIEIDEDKENDEDIKDLIDNVDSSFEGERTEENISEEIIEIPYTSKNFPINLFILAFLIITLGYKLYENN